MRRVRGNCATCRSPLTKRWQARFCSKSCASRAPKSRKARSKTCAACGVNITRRYPCMIARLSVCSKSCEGEMTRRKCVARRLGMVQDKYGVLSLRERELFTWGYKLGYARHSNRERRQRAARLRSAA